MDLADDYLSLFKRNTRAITAVSNSSFDIESPKSNQDNILSRLLQKQKNSINSDAFGTDNYNKKEILYKTIIYVGSEARNFLQTPNDTQRVFEEAFEKQFEVVKTKLYLN